MLGFTHVWGRSQRGRTVVRQITAKGRVTYAPVPGHSLHSSCPDSFRASMFSARWRQSVTGAGATAKRTMRPFDEMCPTPIENMPPKTIRALRLRTNASQAVLTPHLNVTAGPAVGTRRETPPRRLPQAPDTVGEGRPWGGGVRVGGRASRRRTRTQNPISPSCGRRLHRASECSQPRLSTRKSSPTTGSRAPCIEDRTKITASMPLTPLKTLARHRDFLLDLFPFQMHLLLAP